MEKMFKGGRGGGKKCVCKISEDKQRGWVDKERGN